MSIINNSLPIYYFKHSSVKTRPNHVCSNGAHALSKWVISVICNTWSLFLCSFTIMFHGRLSGNTQEVSHFLILNIKDTLLASMVP